MGPVDHLQGSSNLIQTILEPLYSLDHLDQQSPLQRLVHPVLAKAGLQVWIKRDDLLLLPKDAAFPAFCGNKWRKLKYNLRQARQQGSNLLLTFGGAYSNHIAAVAAAGSLFGFSTVGVIRGEPHEPMNPTLTFAKKAGMRLIYLSRSAFRQKEDPQLLSNWRADLGAFFLVPEGGTNALALRGCRELGQEIVGQLGQAPDYLCVGAGTGGTAAGLIQCAKLASTQVLIFPALKGDFMQGTIRSLCGETAAAAWEIVPDYHFGGYARWNQPLLDTIRSFQALTGVPLDPIYTGKLIHGFLAEAEKGRFPDGACIVLVHTGGLQGIVGFQERFGIDLAN